MQGAAYTRGCRTMHAQEVPQAGIQQVRVVGVEAEAAVVGVEDEEARLRQPLRDAPRPRLRPRRAHEEGHGRLEERVELGREHGHEGADPEQGNSATLTSLKQRAVSHGSSRCACATHS